MEKTHEPYYSVSFRGSTFGDHRYACGGNRVRVARPRTGDATGRDVFKERNGCR
jgi:hypothetical protein